MNGDFLLSLPAALDCEVLVVGSGAGGCMAADALAGAGADVLMIEEGPYVPQSAMPKTSASEVQAMWRGGGLTAAFGPVPVAYAEARCVGGGTEINSGIMQRVPDALLEEWARIHALADFGADALRPYYDKVWAELVPAAPPETGPPGRVAGLLQLGAQRKGLRHEALVRAADGGRRHSMTATLLPRAQARGMRLVAQCEARKIIWKRGAGGRAVVRGVEAHATGPDGQRRRVHIACKQLFLAAGAIHTPALLRRSGITENIGNSLRLHPVLKVLADFGEPTGAMAERVPLAAITEFMPSLRMGGSVFTPGFFGMALAENWRDRAALLPRHRDCALYYTMARAQARGRVRPLPGMAEPLVRYAPTDTDRAALARGLESLAGALLAAGARRVIPSLAGHPGWDSESAIDAMRIMESAPARAQMMAIHLMGSCPMHGDRAQGAVDPFGRLYGFKNAVIADASAMPEAPGVNPQATVMALAARAAASWLAVRGQSV
ncbi:MAG: FAD-binding protein [Alphaproteobacteria bacterium]|nr:FAD-binding protein [Alphaproteobacteria bacterium]